MIATISILGLALLLVALIWKIGMSRVPSVSSVDDWEQKKLWANARSFELLIDGESEAYLKEALPPSMFFAIQRKRTGLAIRCAERIGQNASMLLQVAQRAAYHPDTQMVSAARQLSKFAWRVRLNAFLAVCCLRIRYVIPGADIRIPRRYLLQVKLMETNINSIVYKQSPA